MQEAHKKEVVRRLKSVEGHVGGVIRMTESDTYCIGILQQIQAVQSALDKVAGLILENHLETCVTTAIRGDDAAERERVLHELLEIFHQDRQRRKQVDPDSPVVNANSGTNGSNQGVEA